MKEIKDVKIEIRLTPEEKQNIKDFAATHHTTVSEMVRMGLARVMNQQKEQEDYL